MRIPKDRKLAAVAKISILRIYRFRCSAYYHGDAPGPTGQVTAQTATVYLRSNRHTR